MTIEAAPGWRGTAWRSEVEAAVGVLHAESAVEGGHRRRKGGAGDVGRLGPGAARFLGAGDQGYAQAGGSIHTAVVIWLV